MLSETINKKQMHYQFDGLEHGPVLLLSHSLGTDLTMWDAVTRVVGKHFRVLRYDTRGHGQTPTSANLYSIAELGQDVLDLMDILAIPTVYFCGLSMGGLIGQWLAIHHPHRIEKLILCNTASGISDEDTWNRRISIVRENGLSAISDEVIERWLTPAFRKANPSLYRHWLSRFLATDPEGYVACCAAIRDTDLQIDLHRISTATLVVAGIWDSVTTVDHARQLQAGIPNAQLVLLPAAHLSAVEVADILALHLLYFLSSKAHEPLHQEYRAPDRAVYDYGMTVRRAVLGDAHVDAANSSVNDFNADFQDFITRYAWGEVWPRPGLSRHTRSLITLGMLIALNREAEFKMHIQAAINNGVTREEIKETIIHSALYCGLPAANAAFHAAADMLKQQNS